MILVYEIGYNFFNPSGKKHFVCLNAVIGFFFILLMPVSVQADILSKTSHSRQAYLDRVLSLSEHLETYQPVIREGGAQASRQEIRALALTLQFALRDLMTNEGKARSEKVEAPGLLFIQRDFDVQNTPSHQISSPQDTTILLSEMPLDWILQHAGKARDSSQNLVKQIEQQPGNSKVIYSLILSIRDSVAALGSAPR